MLHRHSVNTCRLYYYTVLLLVTIGQLQNGKNNNMMLFVRSFSPSSIRSLTRHLAKASVQQRTGPSSLLHVLTPPPPSSSKTQSFSPIRTIVQEPTPIIPKDRNQEDPPSSEPSMVLKPLIVCGPSGVGKGTIINQYMTNHDGSQHFGFTVSHTTRTPRPGEEDGVHYHFVTREQMDDAIDHGEFLEYAHVHGNTYGTSLESLRTVQRDMEKLPLLDIDVQGVKHIKDYIAESSFATREMQGSSLPDGPSSLQLDAKYIFIAPPSLEMLRERLEGRGTETPESLEKRTRNAKAELEYGMIPGNFDRIIVNEDLDTACLDFVDAIRELYPQNIV